MQENVPQHPERPEELLTEKESFFAARKFPGAPEPTPVAPAPTVRARGNTFQRVILPLVIFIGAIGVIAWGSQYLPSWVGDTTPNSVTTDKPAIVFYQAQLGKPTLPDSPGKLDFQQVSAGVFALWTMKSEAYDRHRV
jgi:hypothetical protein